jgi:hypothetical protein
MPSENRSHDNSRVEARLGLACTSWNPKDKVPLHQGG